MDDQFFSAFAVGLLAFVRIVFIFQQAPILGSKHIKGQAKVGLAACLAVVAFPNLPMPANMPEDPRGFILALLAQVVVGLAIGYVSFLVMAAAQFGGEMMDIQMGLSVAASMDPSSGGTSKLLNRLNFYVAMMLYLMVDGHHMLLRALFRSFQVIPVTEFRVSGRLVSEFITHTEEIFLIGLQVAAPPLAALFITQVAMGLLARVAPQMNVFMLSFPLNIAIGLMLFSIGLPVIQGLLLEQFEINHDRTWDAILIMGDRNDPTLPTENGFVLDDSPPIIPEATPNPLPDHLQDPK
ncbi:MAG: flagellar biosynthetic protein FliR [Vulcanimicrobiota bacterium]